MSTIARLTIDQYDRMIAGGVFETGPRRQRIELIAGELREMSPIGPRHEDAVDVLMRWSVKKVPEDRVRVRIQSSIDIPEHDCAPEPDIAWVKERRYSDRRPSVADALLIIEVADSSLEYDRGEKAALYAAAGIADYWVVDIRGECLHVHRQPQSGQYTSRQTFRGLDEVSPLSFPQIVLRVGTVFRLDASGDALEDSPR
jgi:Uma2 family endonuclease